MGGDFQFQFVNFVGSVRVARPDLYAQYLNFYIQLSARNLDRPASAKYRPIRSVQQYRWLRNCTAVIRASS